jgi:hypothetical protein
MARRSVNASPQLRQWKGNMDLEIERVDNSRAEHPHREFNASVPWIED